VRRGSRLEISELGLGRRHGPTVVVLGIRGLTRPPTADHPDVNSR
jgi:hypothetical protein